MSERAYPLIFCIVCLICFSITVSWGDDSHSLPSSKSLLEKEVEALVFPEGMPERKVIPTNSSYEQEQDINFTYDGKTYRKSDVIRDFISVAFSETQWYEYIGREAIAFTQLTTMLRHRSQGEKNGYLDILKGGADWLQGYVDINDLPKNGVLNRWGDDITIGIDWPPYKIGPSSGPQKDRHKEFYEIARSEILKLAPPLSKATKREVKFIEPSLGEYGQVYGKIRIIPVSTRGPGLFFKSPINKSAPDGHLEISDLERKLWGAVPFTPYSRAQVDGYLLPKADNTLGIVICKINPIVGKDLVRALIKECLFRALGLPDTSQIKSSGILAAWNSEFESADGQVNGVIPDYNIVGQYDISGGYPPFPSNQKKSSSIPTIFSEYDLSLVHLMYCSSIRPGMVASEIIAILSKDEKCFY